MNLPYQVNYDENNNVLDELHKKFVDKMCIFVCVNLYFTQNQQDIKSYHFNQFVKWNIFFLRDLFCFAKKMLSELTYVQFIELVNVYYNMIMTQLSYIFISDIEIACRTIQMLLHNTSESMETTILTS
jgi:hypothetical protein